MKFILPLILALCGTVHAIAQTEDVGKRPTSQTLYGLMGHYGSIFVHTPQVKNTTGAKPYGIEAEWSHEHTDLQTLTKWGFFNRTGWSMQYFYFNTPILGNTVSAAYFIEPIFKLTNRAELRLKGSMGLAYLSNPNPNHIDSSEQANNNYGSHMNAFLQLRLGITYHISTKVSAYISGNFNHNSNGGFAIPNRGINYPTLAIGVLVHQLTNQLPVYKKLHNNWRNQHNGIRWNIGVFGSPKEGWTGSGIKYSKKVLMGGLVMASKQVSGINALTLGAETYYDGGLHLTKTKIGDNSSSLFAGLLVGNEFLLNNFAFSQQLGFHVYKQTNYYNKMFPDHPLNTFYQRYGLTYQVNGKMKIGFNLLARAAFADFIDLRVLWRLK